MKYCPYCAEPLTRPGKICPYCKKSLDFDLMKSMLEPDQTSQIKKGLLLRVWIREKSYLIYPIVALLIGFVLGAILSYGYARVQFAGEKSQYQDRIAQLEQTITQQESSAGNLQSDLENRLKKKDDAIKILIEQKDIYSRLISFTNRFAGTCQITPNTPEDIDNYKRNTLYLSRLFEDAQAKLVEAKVETGKNYNLQALPELDQ